MFLRTSRAIAATILSAGLTLAPALAHAANPPAGPETTAERPPPKGEFVGSLGAAAGSSTWRGDPAALTTLKLGYRFADWIAPYYMSRLGYAPVNDRSILTFALGVQAWARIGKVRPYARVAAMHQHEESTSVIKDDLGGALFGVGDGIRHRYGGEAALGVDIPFHTKDKLQLVATFEAVGDFFGDARGPGAYVLGSAAIGLHYALF